MRWQPGADLFQAFGRTLRPVSALVAEHRVFYCEETVCAVDIMLGVRVKLRNRRGLIFNCRGLVVVTILLQSRGPLYAYLHFGSLYGDIVCCLSIAASFFGLDAVS